MGLIKNYRPDGLEVTLDDESVVKVMVIRETQSFGIIARIKKDSRVTLWGKDDAAAHVSDTEEQFVAKIKEVLA